MLSISDRIDDCSDDEDLLVFRRKDLCEAKQNVECSKKRSKYFALLMRDSAFGGGGG